MHGLQGSYLGIEGVDALFQSPRAIQVECGIAQQKGLVIRQPYVLP
jgi:hypothetical protein